MVTQSKLSTGTYWCARDLAGGAFIGNHHFILIIDTKENLEYTGIPVQSVPGVNDSFFITIGGTSDNGSVTGKLAAYFNNDTDIKAVKEYLNPEKYTSFFKSDLDLEPKLVMSDTNFAWKVTYRAGIYKKTSKKLLPEYNLADNNCSAWVNTLFAVMGVSDEKRRRLSNMSGVDWGENDEIPRRLFTE